jgi:hypothetical protein
MRARRSLTEPVFRSTSDRKAAGDTFEQIPSGASMQRILVAPSRRATALVIIAVAVVASIGDARAAISTINLRGSQKISTGFSRTPVIAAGDANRITAAWADVTSADGIYASDLRLGSWVRPVRILGSQDGEDPVIAMAPNGSTLVAWEVQHGDPRSGMVGVSYRAPGGNFLPARYVGVIADSATNTEPAIAVSSSGRWVVVWRHTDDASVVVQAAFGAAGVLGATRNLESGSTDPTVAIDSAGRAIALYARSDGNTTAIRQALAPGGGTFAASTTVDPHAGNASDAVFVETNGSGQVVAGWGDDCEDDCPQISFARMAVGTTSAGVGALQQRVSNPNETDDPMTGPTRKWSTTLDGSIDEAGNASMVWDATTAGMSGYDLWVAHYAPGTGFSQSSSFGTSTQAVDGELQVVAEDGLVMTSWVSTTGVDEPAHMYFNQVAFPAAGGPSTWPTPTMVSPASADSDSNGVALSPGGIAAIVFRVADRIWANTNAPRDTTPPHVIVPANGIGLNVTRGTTRWSVRCPATEAACAGTVTARPRAGGAAVATGTFYVLGGRTGFAQLRLTRSANALIATGRGIPVTITTKVRDAAGNAGPNAVRNATLLHLNRA